MKTIKIIRLILTAVMVIAVVTMFSCGGDAAPTAADGVRGLMISGTWKISELKIDDVSKNSYPNLTINFTGDGFTATNGAPVWPASGTWSFTDDTGTVFKRDDETVVTINSITASNLTMTLSWSTTTLGPGRKESVAGKHVFIMVK